MHHGDSEFGQHTSTLFYHVTIRVIVDGASLTHYEHQCFTRVSLDDDVLQLEVLRQGQSAMYGPQFCREARRCYHT
ncbi:hypothetical protein MTR67_042197 [Solanum verrucosum]|uniref:Uncharacterized protein n=1 Tax=Solanum verrucosum TaxID=315347 RepID=A0AAF0ZQX6_SOLVR|nr:hypothetical protein MTR67_042197 [Solanum verrucosum]